MAYYSVLLFNVLDVARLDYREVFHDALYYRDEARELFLHGGLTLREWGLADLVFWSIIAKIRKEARGLKHVPEELEGIDAALTSVYYGNFSVFQSLPDLWAIEQLFPIMPIHRLRERPRTQAIISDTTCDFDGRIERFSDLHDVARWIPLHDRVPGEDYVEYDPKLLANRFRGLVESVLRQKRITVLERNAAMLAYETGMRGYTYPEE